MNGWAAWRARPWLWGIPLAFLLLNLGLFVFYRMAYAGQVEVLQDRFSTENAAYQKLREQREGLETYLDRVKDSSDGISDLYLNHFSTESERFTAATAEIKRLARTAGLDPSSFGYPSQQIGDLELRRQGMTFSVDGTYDQVRRFINFLELSEHFFVLEQIAVNAGGDLVQSDPRLSISVSVSTVFATESLARRTAFEIGRRAQRAGVTDVDDAPADDELADGDTVVEEDAEAGSSVDDTEADELPAGDEETPPNDTEAEERDE